MKKYFIPIASDFISQKEVDFIIRSNTEFLKNLNCEQIEFDQLLLVEQFYYFLITGGTEQQVRALQKKRNNKFVNEDVILLAHASHNSLPACLEFLAKLQQDDSRGKIVYRPEAATALDADHKPAISKIDGLPELQGLRIGSIGAPSDWLVASSPSFEIVKQNFGIDVIPIDLDEVKQIFQRITKEQVIDISAAFIDKAVGIYEPSLLEIYDNIKIYLAMKKLIEKYKLDAVTIRCFDLVLDLKTTGCFALSRLNDEGIIAGCEGDLNSTIGMLWAQKTIGKLPWMANPSQMNLEDNSLILAHCTVPSSLVTSYKIRSHFESGLGVGIQGEFPKQKVTIIRIGGKNLDKIWQAEGEIIESGNAEDLCRTQIKVKLDNKYSVQDLLTNPLGNHLVVVGR